jgi:hypothetical protein
MKKKTAKQPKQSKRTVHIVSSLLIAALASGCATPLTKSKDGAHLAKVVGVPQHDVQFLSYCHFGECRPWEKEVRFTPGIVVATSDAVHLLGGNYPNVSAQQKITLRYREIAGVDMRRFVRNGQVQMLHREHLIVVGVTNGTIGDPVRAEELFRLIKSKGVKPFASERLYRTEVPPMIFIPVPVS